MVEYSLIKAKLLLVSFLLKLVPLSLRPGSGPLSWWLPLAYPSPLTAGLPAIFEWFSEPESTSPAVHAPATEVVAVAG